MILLTSTGFTNHKVYETIEKNITECINKACIIPTGIPTKAKHPIALRTKEFLKSKGIKAVDFIDVERQNICGLREYDLVVVLGGVYTKLVKCMRQSGADKVLVNMIQNNKVIVGASAGAMLLSTGNKLAGEFNNIEGLPIEELEEGLDISGLNMTNHILFPHYDMFVPKVNGLEEKLFNLEQKYNIDIIRLKNMDFIYVDNQGNSHLVNG